MLVDRAEAMSKGAKESRAILKERKKKRSYKTAVQAELDKIQDREELARKRINALGTGPTYLEARESLLSCDEETPCGLSACVECAYQFRLAYIVSALRFFGHCLTLHQVTILDRIVELDELNGDIVNPKNLLRRLKRIFKKCDLGNVSAFGNVEIAYEKVVGNSSQKKGRFILHYHIIFIGESKEKLEALRIAFPEGQLKRRVVIEPVKNTLEDRVKSFSYCCKRTDYYKEKTKRGRITYYRKPQAIPLQYRRVLLNYLAKYRMQELQLHHNISFRRGLIADD